MRCSLELGFRVVGRDGMVSVGRHVAGDVKELGRWRRVFCAGELCVLRACAQLKQQARCT